MEGTVLHILFRRARLVFTALVALALVALVIGAVAYYINLQERPPVKYQYDQASNLPDSVKVSQSVDTADVEPDSVEIYHSNPWFAGAELTFTTAVGSATACFPEKIVKDEDGWIETESIIFANPGHMRDGWTLDVRYWHGRRHVVFRSQRTGQRDQLSIHLYISASGRAPRLYMNYVCDSQGREIILLSARPRQPSQIIAAI
ncbi:MAG: hypothetical protein WC497_04435 [Patescibacteria group bacterium]